MGSATDQIDPRLQEWLLEQPVFFVATAPSSNDGHINCSPKDLRDTFAIVDDTTVAFLDLTGSGIETVAHLRENGRILLMFCAFDDPPNIVRLYGRGEVLTDEHPDFEVLRPRFGDRPGTRSIIRIQVDRVSESCGFGVPQMQFIGERDLLDSFARSRGESGLRDYRDRKNARSIDGLPGMDPDV